MTRFFVGRTPRMRLSTARHEAAHAVVAMHLGIRYCFSLIRAAGQSAYGGTLAGVSCRQRARQSLLRSRTPGARPQAVRL